MEIIVIVIHLMIDRQGETPFLQQPELIFEGRRKSALGITIYSFFRVIFLLLLSYHLFYPQDYRPAKVNLTAV